MRSESNAPQKWRTKSWFLLHDNAPAHRSVLVKVLLAKNSVTSLERPPYFPELAAADFYLFFQLKSTLKGRRFCNATGIIKNATEELKRLSKRGLQECFQHFYGR
jgi:transposase